MKYCSNCGKEIVNAVKFCSECGNKLNAANHNKIDNTVENFTSSFKKVRDEIGSSETINKISHKANDSFKIARFRVLRFLGYLGAIILFLGILYPIVTGNDFFILQNYNYYIANGRDRYWLFVASLLIPFILPILFIALAIGSDNPKKILKIRTAYQNSTLYYYATLGKEHGPYSIRHIAKQVESKGLNKMCYVRKEDEDNYDSKVRILDLLDVD